MRARMGRSVVFGLVVLFLVTLFLSGCEKRDWTKAQQTNTVEAYKGYLEKYPSGKFATEAKAAIENLDWKVAQQANTVEAYQEFMKKYPSSKLASTATEKIAALEEEAMVMKESEAIDNLAAIRTGEESYRAKQEAKQAKVKVKKNLYLACKPSPPAGGTDAEADPWVDAGGFRDIGFEPSTPVLYQYAVTVNKTGTAFTATATGDLDGDGEKVTFTITNENTTPVKSPETEH